MNNIPQNPIIKETANVNNKVASSIDLSKRLVVILDNLLESESWDTSLFLRNARRRIDELRQEAESLLQQNANVGLGDFNSTSQVTKTIPPGSIKIFISLYQSDSANMQSWLHTIKTLALYNVTRPTYSNEHHIREMISSKTDIQKHGYAEVFIHESDIIPIDPLPVDSLGHELLILKEGSVRLQNIVGFVHANKKRYSIHNTELVYEGDLQEN